MRAEKHAKNGGEFIYILTTIGNGIKNIEGQAENKK